MPIIVTKDSTDFYLVPTPLVGFNRNTYNNNGRNGFGATYSITLEGTLLPNKGNPFYDMTAGITDAELSTSDWTKPSSPNSAGADNEPNYGYDADQLLASTLRKQEKIRELFSNDVVDGVSQPIMINITNWGETSKGYQFAAFVDSIDFGSEGRGVLPTTYTISLRTSSFFDSANDGDFAGSGNEYNPTYKVEDISENFDIAEYDTFNVNFDGIGLDSSFNLANKLYLVSKSTTVVGSPVYDNQGAYVSGMAPWQQASGYVYNVLGLGTGTIPDTRFNIAFHSSGHKAGDRVVTESIDKEAGSYSVDEQYILFSGDPIVHTINVNTDVDQAERRVVNVDGTIQGFNTLDPFANTRNNYANAINYYNTVVNPTFNSGINEAPYVIPSAYYWAKSVSDLSWLNPVATSKSLGRDLSAGSVTYSFGFDDRPPALISGSVLESITVNDTYPGEIFSATPVIGRNQPILQYLNSRSEYKRSLNINITMGEYPVKQWNNTGVINNTNGYWNDASRSQLQTMLINSKPSNIEMSSGDLSAVFEAVNPVNDPNFTVRGGKCFHSAPTENWDSYSKTYTYSIEWTYEREV